MKNSLLILLFFCIQFIYAQDENNQNISINFENSSTVNVIKKVEEHRDCVYTELINVTGKQYDAITQKLSMVLKEKG